MNALDLTRGRRGWCPGVRRPMATGDGLLVRVHPSGGTLTAAQVRVLAQAAEAHGNGHLDVTARGNLQIRGVRDETYPALLALLDAMGLVEPEGDGPSRLTAVSPLAGLDPHNRVDAGALAAAIEGQAGRVADLPAKFFVAVDGGGNMPLEGIGADLHLLATERDSLAFGFASPDGLRWGGASSLDRASQAIFSILEGFAAMRRGGRTEARRLRELAPDLARELAALASLSPTAPPLQRPSCPRAGAMELDGGHAVLLALPFGRCEAAQLAQTAAWSEAFGDGEIRLSFTRGVLLARISEMHVPALLDEARRLGFITDAQDPRLSVQACPGRPACGSASTAASDDALRVAGAAENLLRTGATIHVSGCPKGCAHPGAADLTLVGRENGSYGIVVGGSSRDAPRLTGSLEEIMTRLSRLQSTGDLHRAFEEAAP